MRDPRVGVTSARASRRALREQGKLPSLMEISPSRRTTYVGTRDFAELQAIVLYQLKNDEKNILEVLHRIGEHASLKRVKIMKDNMIKKYKDEIYPTIKLKEIAKKFALHSVIYIKYATL